MKNWVSFSPHIKDRVSANKIYLFGIFAALPALFDGIIKYGFNALFIVLSSIISAVIIDLVCSWILNKKFGLKEFSSLYIGLLIGMVIPPAVPFWMGIIASAFSIIVVKTLAGGTGRNFVSEVSAAKIILALIFGVSFYKFIDPVSGNDTVVTLTDAVRSGANVKIDYIDLFMGSWAGGIGETGVVYLLAGGIFLSVTKVIDFKLPLGYLVSTFVFGYLFMGLTAAVILTCSVTFIAVFVITDYATSPDYGWARFVYGVLLGMITAIIFRFGEYRLAGFYASMIGGLVYTALKGIALPTKRLIKG